MEPEHSTPVVESLDKFESLKRVTPLSKYLAMILFIFMPFIGGWIGYTYAPEKFIEIDTFVVKDESREVGNATERKDNNGYVRVISDWPAKVVIGNVRRVEKDSITISEVKSYKCFFSWTYINGNEEEIDRDKLDKEFNTENYPWCTDPSGGTFYEETGESLIFEIGEDTILSEGAKIFFEEALQSSSNENSYTGIMVAVYMKGALVIRIEDIYND